MLTVLCTFTSSSPSCASGKAIVTYHVHSGVLLLVWIVVCYKGLHSFAHTFVNWELNEESYTSWQLHSLLTFTRAYNTSFLVQVTNSVTNVICVLLHVTKTTGARTGAQNDDDSVPELNNKHYLSQHHWKTFTSPQTQLLCDFTWKFKNEYICLTTASSPPSHVAIIY